MGNSVLILGNSGTGKSTAVRTLPPEETFIINVVGKMLPFKGASKKYKEANKENPTGNYFVTDKQATIGALLEKINNNRPEIKYLVIDDWNYALTSDFMGSALQKGYEKFSVLALNAWSVLEKIKNLRDDLIVFIMMHTDIKDDGMAKPRTIGKMLDEKVCIEGLFTNILHSHVVDGEYFFITNHDGHHLAKTPLGMFNEKKISNDLLLVANTLNAYFNDSEEAPE